MNSWTFLLFAGLAIVVIRLIQRAAPPSYMAPLQNVVLFSFNAAFLWMVGSDASAILALVIFLNFTFLFAHLNRKTGGTLRFPTILVVTGAIWAFLFLVKDPQVFGTFNPFLFLDLRIIGLSYLCFRAISVILDAPELEQLDYLTFLNYMLFFPTLLAGPIERYEPFHEDSHAPRPLDIDLALSSAQRIAIGFFKKFVLADNLAPFGIFAFGGDPDVAVSLLWFGVLMQLALIYLDFGGYCDIVIGLARLMGFKICENFDRPYVATNLQDFWNRWHMSLTFWVRDYVFTPICKIIFWRVDKKNQFPFVTGAYVVTMLVIALWHKVSLGFLLFGLMHGAALVFVQLKRQTIDKRADGMHPVLVTVLKPPPLAASILTYVFFALSTTLWFFPVATSGRIFLRMLTGGVF